MNPTFTRQVIHAQHMTIARFYFKKGGLVPVHQHVNEQVCLVEEGALKFILEGNDTIVRAGEVMQVPPNVPHAVEALEDTAGYDLFSPVREDWIRGEDAYLRK